MAISGKSGAVHVSDFLMHACDVTWGEQVVGNVTDSLDTTDYKTGSGSAKFVVADAFTTGVIGSIAVTLDLTPYTEITAWVKSSVALDASDWAILTDETADCASPQTHVLPALTANTWTFVRISTDMSGTDYETVISLGLNQTVDKGAMSFWIDDVRAGKAVAGIKSWTLDYTVDPLEVTDFADAGVRAYIAGCSQWAGSFEGYKEAAPLTIGGIYGLELRESGTATQQYRGSALITGLHANTTFDGVVTYGYDFQGTMGLVVATA